MNKIVIIIMLMMTSITFSTQIYARAKPIDLKNGTMLDSPRRLKDFQLTSTQGPFDRRSFRGHWSLLFFGFTHCPTICPTALGKLAAAYKLLQKQTIKLPQVVFISLDPQNDTIPIIAKYLSHFNTHFIGATGSKEEIDKLTKQLGVFYEQTNLSKDGNYISHSTMIFIIAPNGKWAGLMKPPYDAESIANDFMKIQKK